MQRTRLRAFVALTVTSLGLAGVSLLGGTAEAEPKPQPQPQLRTQSDKVPDLVTGHLLAINDFHGQIDKPTGSSATVNGTPAGGVEYLASWIKDLRSQDKAADSKYVYTVAAGDLVGASPLVSAAFHDEPVVDEMNALGLDVTSVGNHEFDEGVAELKRLANGGCHPVDGCADGDGFRGADYPMLAANVVDKKTGKPIFPAYIVRRIGSVKVGFVGMTLEGTPGIVNPAGIKSVKFLDEARTANKYAEKLRAKGVKSIVLLLHEGGAQSPGPGAVNDCAGFDGAVVPIVAKLRPEYRAVISGHTHQWYNCKIPNAAGRKTLVTSAGSLGRVVTDVSLIVDQARGRIVHARAENVVVENSDPSFIDRVAQRIADKYREAVEPIANKVVGSITADITKVSAPSGENAMGNTIADAQLAYTQGAGAQLALMNPGGVRGELIYANQAGTEDPGEVTYGEAFAVQPFNNLVATQTLTGAQLKDVLEQQFVGYAGQTTQKILPSDGFTYTYSTSAEPGSKVSDMKLDGTPVDPAATYRVTTNDFLANGGDGFTKLTAGTDRTTAPGFDVDALTAYLGDGPVAPAPTNRITVVP
jgi:5'-nucleotidase